MVLADNGTYYLRAKIAGKLIWRSLDTDVFTTAKLRLPDKLKEVRDSMPSVTTKQAAGSPKMTVKEAYKMYEADVQADPRLKPTTKKFRLRFATTIDRTWQQLWDMEVRKVSETDCKDYLNRYENGASKYQPPRAKRISVSGDSPTSVNNLIAFLRHVFDKAIGAQVISKNPAANLKKKPAKKKLLHLPNKSQFDAMVARIRSIPGKGRIAADLMQGLAYSGMRVGESRKLRWNHLDFERGMLTIPGEKTADSARIIPMTAAFKAHVEVLKAHRNGVKPDGRVFEAGSCERSLKHACKALNVQHMTHHDLRHYFATTCIEAGVDIPTVALWLGHKDGGALAMRTYGHIRPSHSIEAAKKVKF